MTSSLNYSARVSNILLSSIAEEVGFKVGDTIISINGTAPRDLIDYNFLCSDVFLLLCYFCAFCGIIGLSLYFLSYCGFFGLCDIF